MVKLERLNDSEFLNALYSTVASQIHPLERKPPRDEVTPGGEPTNKGRTNTEKGDLFLGFCPC